MEGRVKKNLKTNKTPKMDRGKVTDKAEKDRH